MTNDQYSNIQELHRYETEPFSRRSRVLFANCFNNLEFAIELLAIKDLWNMEALLLDRSCGRSIASAAEGTLTSVAWYSYSEGNFAV